MGVTTVEDGRFRVEEEGGGHWVVMVVHGGRERMVRPKMKKQEHGWDKGSYYQIRGIRFGFVK